MSDTLEMTNYLRYRFGQAKIYLMGHLVGTFNGILVVAQTSSYCDRELIPCLNDEVHC